MVGKLVVDFDADPRVRMTNFCISSKKICQKRAYRTYRHVMYRWKGIEADFSSRTSPLEDGRRLRIDRLGKERLLIKARKHVYLHVYV